MKNQERRERSKAQATKRAKKTAKRSRKWPKEAPENCAQKAKKAKNDWSRKSGGLQIWMKKRKKHKNDLKRRPKIAPKTQKAQKDQKRTQRREKNDRKDAKTQAKLSGKQSDGWHPHECKEPGEQHHKFKRPAYPRLWQESSMSPWEGHQKKTQKANIQKHTIYDTKMKSLRMYHNDGPPTRALGQWKQHLPRAKSPRQVR